MSMILVLLGLAGPLKISESILAFLHARFNSCLCDFSGASSGGSGRCMSWGRSGSDTVAPLSGSACAALAHFRLRRLSHTQSTRTVALLCARACELLLCVPL